MPIGIAIADVKQRLAISGTADDARIQGLIDDYQPYLTHVVEPVYLNDPDTYLQLALNLAALEIVCGEVIAMFARDPGAMESVVVGDLDVSPPNPSVLRMLDMRATGWQKLLPFLKKHITIPVAEVLSAGGKNPDEEAGS
jgi:hypothetical protein